VSSVNYSLQEYANDVIYTFADSCTELDLPMPHIISESGRALTAHHAVLITQVIDKESPPPATTVDGVDGLLGEIDRRGPLECLHEAAAALGEAQTQYTLGLLSLPQRADAENTYFAVCRALIGKLDPSIRAHRDALDELRDKLAEKYFCNFSVFQSIPDAWAIDQVFPILPIHRLDEMPTQRATLCDLTCDSDGKIDAYVDREGLMPTLALHALEEGTPYLLGFFMVGAYQEILGDMHNLFGDTNAVNVVLDGKGGWKLEGAENGDRTDELLRYVHFAPEELAHAYRRKLEASKLPPGERDALQKELESGLSGYTYLS
jgi:arginine decarboxylase